MPAHTAATALVLSSLRVASTVLMVFLAAASGVAEVGGADSSLPPGRLPFKSYGTDHGLRCFYFHDVIQDSDGFIWVAGEEGVYRYDGALFARFGLEEGLPSTIGYRLAAAPGGRVWAGTMDGLAFFDGSRFVAAGKSVGLPTSTVLSLAVDHNGAVYVGFDGGLFASSDGTSFKLVPGWPGGAATAVHVAKQGETVYAATGTRIGQTDGRGAWTFTDIGTLSNGDPVGALALDGSGRLWARSTDGHLFKREPGKRDFEDMSSLLPLGYGTPFLALDSDGELLVTTVRGVMRHRRGAWSSVGGIAEGHSSSWEAALEDREGTLWVVGTGVYRLLGAGAWMTWSPGEGLPAPGVWCIFRDRAGRLWIGNREGLCQGTDIDWAVIPGTERQLIRSIVEAKDGSIWATGSTQWVYRVEPGSNRASQFGAEHGVPRGTKWDMLIDGQGTFWLATDVGLYTLRGDRWELEPLPGGAEKTLVRSLLLDPAGRLWTLGAGGVFCREAGGWRRYTDADGLRRTNVAYGAFASDGDLWLTYYESLGVERLHIGDGKLEVLERFNTGNGLYTGKVYSIAEDPEGNIWIGLGAGIDRLARNDDGTHRIARHYGKGDGLIDEDCTGNGILIESNSSVFVGSNVGLSYFQAEKEKVHEAPPVVRIIVALLGGKPARVDGENHARAPHSSFEVFFAGLSFVNESAVRHEVRMIGLEPEWRYSRVRGARYPALQPGKYRFEVRARVASGPWSEPVGISFTIE
jgi:ligand-binding sensor domain-containing protein